MEKLSISTIKTSKFTLYFCTSFLGFFFLIIFLIHGWPQQTFFDSYESLQPTITTLSILANTNNMVDSYAPTPSPPTTPSMSELPLVEVLYTPMQESMMGSSNKPPSPSLSKPQVQIFNTPLMEEIKVDSSKVPSISSSMSKPKVEVANIPLQRTIVDSPKAPSPSQYSMPEQLDEVLNYPFEDPMIDYYDGPTPSPSPSPSISKPLEEVINSPMQETMMGSFKAPSPLPSMSKPQELVNFPMQETMMESFKAPTLSPSISKPPVEVVSPIAPTNSQSLDNNNYMPLGGGEESSSKECNIFEGNWVYDPQAYPLYHARKCPFLSQQVTCIKNGRPDSLYEHWRWQPSGCDIPRFNGTHMLEMLRGKTVALVGDSINRNMWESLACMLYSSIPRSRAIVDVHSGHFHIFRAKDYNFVVEFYWSPFIIPLDKTSFGKTKVLRIEKLPKISWRWRRADVLVFNTGHWWTHQGALQTWDVYEFDGKLVKDMDRLEGFGHGLKTWANWVDSNVNPNKTTVFFRGISPQHRGKNWCYNQTWPITNETYIKTFPESMIQSVKKTVKEMKTPVNYLDITGLSEYRKDGHTSVYTVRQQNLITLEERKEPKKYSDCAHWCLPGVPDTWNALLYASLFQKIYNPMQSVA